MSNVLSLSQQTEIGAFMRKDLKCIRTEEGHSQYAHGWNDGRVALEGNFPFPCTASNVAYVRKQIFGKKKRIPHVKKPMGQKAALAFRLDILERAVLAVNKRLVAAEEQLSGLRLDHHNVRPA